MRHLEGMRLLVVEDDDSIAEPLTVGLGREGFDVTRVTTGRDALAAGSTDLVLLDLGLPDIDGREVCRRIRERSEVPIIVVTARSDEVDRVLLLEIGADDYVVKPFGFRELVARIRAVSRRMAPSDLDDTELRVVGALEVDLRTHEVRLASQRVELTPKEFDLLALLSSDPGAVFARQRILEEVWDAHWYGPTKTLDVHVASLRKKLGNANWVRTVRGVGFKLEVPASEDDVS
jgi:DNA-binding response OmpR family regulator